MEHILMQFLQNNRIDSMVFIIVQIAVQYYTVNLVKSLANYNEISHSNL